MNFSNCDFFPNYGSINAFGIFLIMACLSADQSGTSLRGLFIWIGIARIVLKTILSATTYTQERERLSMEFMAFGNVFVSNTDIFIHTVPFS